MSKTWGLQYEEETDGQILVWKPVIRNPFKQGDKWQVGLNEKFLTKAREAGVAFFQVRIGQQEHHMGVPSEQDLKAKVKANEYKDEPSRFENSPPMRIFLFTLGDEQPLKAQPLESEAGAWCKKCGITLIGDEGASLCQNCI